MQPVEIVSIRIRFGESCSLCLLGLWSDICLILWPWNFPSSNEVGRIGGRPGESTILRLLNWFLDTGFGVVRFAYISVNRSRTVWCIRSLSQLFTGERILQHFVFCRQWNCSHIQLPIQQVTLKTPVSVSVYSFFLCLWSNGQNTIWRENECSVDGSYHASSSIQVAILTTKAHTSLWPCTCFYFLIGEWGFDINLNAAKLTSWLLDLGSATVEIYRLISRFSMPLSFSL